MSEPAADRFDAAGIRARVLDAWRASPARLREDANAEEDAALGAYRDRLVVELVQNACDAALLAGVPGRVRIRLQDGVLDIANTGAPLTADGLVALSTLRASSKRGGESLVGRFGVGFAAVLAVSDEPLVVSGDVAYTWSAVGTRALVDAEPALAAEVARRHGHVPVLRLPFAVADAPRVPDGYATLVRLPLRDAAAGDVARALLEALDPTLPLLLEGLIELDVDGRVLTVREEQTAEGGDVLVLDDGGHVTRWRVATVRGRLDPRLLAHRPVEERERTGFAARALVPADGGWPADVPLVLRAPQPTDERLSLPVLVSVPVPIDPSRRHTVDGPLRDALLGHAAAAVAALARPDPASLALVPTGLAVGEVDGHLRVRVLAALQDRPWLPGDAVLDLGDASAAAYAVLHEVVPGLLPPAWPARSTALDALGVRRLDTADVVELVQGLRQPPAWWRDLYAALADAPDRDALGALPVPLADDGFAGGPRGLLLPDPGLPDVHDLPVKVVHPAAAHDALLRLGATPGSPRAVLEALAPHAGHLTVEQVLPFVAAAVVLPGELPWLTELDLGGDYVPGTPLAAVLDPDAGLDPVPAELVERWGADVLAACGAIAAPVVRHDVDEALDLDGGDEWFDDRGDTSGDAGAIADLDVLAWPDALRVLLQDRDARHAILTPGSYSAWWLRRHPVLGGRLPEEVAAPDADPRLDTVYDPAPDWLDPTVAVAIGCRTEIPADEDGLLDLLDRIGDPARDLRRSQVRALYAAVADDADRIGDAAPPVLVRAIDRDGALTCVAPADAVLVDAPDLLPLVGARAVVPVAASRAAELAPLLGVAIASELADFAIVRTDPLTVADADGAEVRVAWRLLPDGTIHADGPEGQGRAEAWRAGRWSERHAFVAALRDPVSARLSTLEDDLA